ncbi:hypothetical protein Ancab_006310 [Ancistrocladus abbreviatus]
MTTFSVDPRFMLQTSKNQHQHGVVVEEIEGLIRIYKDGCVERLPIIPNVSCTEALGLRVTAKDIVIDMLTNLWVRIYVPCGPQKLPLLVYFHGGGFCVGSAAWSCYHNFLASLAFKAGCVILSINYRLAPENRLPAAYEDGYKVVMWLKQQALQITSEHSWWLTRCNFLSFFLAGDSAGANIAHYVAIQLGSDPATFWKPLCHKGTILIQPFFGGEVRTISEKTPQPPCSALSLAASDTYWRLSLPLGANREHPWCNPIENNAVKMESAAIPATMVSISEMDILKDRNVQFCAALSKAGKVVEMVMYRGVGHAFQILQNSPLSQTRTQEMMAHFKDFINK